MNPTALLSAAEESSDISPNKAQTGALLRLQGYSRTTLFSHILISGERTLSLGVRRTREAFIKIGNYFEGDFKAILSSIKAKLDTKIAGFNGEL